MAKQATCRYNICAAKEYTTSQNEVKTQWVNIGTAVMFDDGSILQNINSLPTGTWWDGSLQLFKQEQRTQQGASQGGYQQQQPQQPYNGGYQQPQPQYAATPQGYTQSKPAPATTYDPPF